MKASTFYTETDNGDVNVHVGRILLVVLGVVVVIGALVFASWGIGIATAPWAGRQNLHRAINNPTNIRSQYEHFFNLSADYQSDIQQLHVAQSQNLGQQVVTGISFHCISIANQYNADAQEYTRNAFLSSQLPPRLDPTACNPGVK